jgi:hypothetical protein
MQTSTEPLPEVLALLSQQARARRWTDSEWAARAGVRKETLSRLRHRRNCDLATLAALAKAVDARLGVLDTPALATTADGHFPVAVSRDYEARLVDLCSSRILDPERWASAGPRFFMAGMAVMLASMPGYERRALLALAERLHPGASEPSVFTRWLEQSPVRPSRFLPFLDTQRAELATRP